MGRESSGLFLYEGEHMTNRQGAVRGGDNMPEPEITIDNTVTDLKVMRGGLFAAVNIASDMGMDNEGVHGQLMAMRNVVEVEMKALDQIIDDLEAALPKEKAEA
jgi:hypothetical protein